MNLNNLFYLTAVSCAVFGAVFLTIPDILLAAHGASLNSGGVLLGRVLGASLLGMACIFWGLRGQTSAAQWPALLAGVIYNGLDVVVGTQAVIGGVLNGKGWGLVIFHALLASAFGYFALMRNR
jgi:hypothetical protein